MRHGLALLPFLGCALAACSNNVSPADAGGDAATDTRSNDVVVTDAGSDATLDAPSEDAGPQPMCDTPAMLDTTFMLDPGAGPNVNVAAAFDGAQVWIVYDRPADDGSGNFDVYVERLRCNGTASIPPFKVNTVPMVNNVDPAIAVADGHVYLAWAGDNGMFPHNIDIYYRTLQIDGTMLMPTEQTLQTTVNGAPMPGIAWMSVIAPLPGERFVIAGTRGLDAPTPHFGVFLQVVDAQGAMIGDALEPDPEGIEQENPTVAATANGSVYVAWSNVDDAGAYHAVATHYAPDATVANAPVPLGTADQSGGPNYAVEPGATGHVYVAFVQPDSFGKGQIYLQDGTALPGSQQPATLGLDGRDDETPVVAAAPGGGAVAWYQGRSSVTWDLHLTRFTYAGSAFQLGADTIVPVTRIAPYYPVGLTYVGGNTYFVAWSEGTSPMLTLRGRFVNLP